MFWYYVFLAACALLATQPAHASVDTAFEFQSDVEEALETYLGLKLDSEVASLEDQWLESQERRLKRSTTTTPAPTFWGMSTSRFVATCIVLFFMIVGCLASIQLTSKWLGKRKIINHGKKLAEIRKKVDADMVAIREKQEEERLAIEAEKQAIMEEKMRIQAELRREMEEKEKEEALEEEMRLEAESAERAKQKEKELKKKKKDDKAGVVESVEDALEAVEKGEDTGEIVLGGVTGKKKKKGDKKSKKK